METWRCRPSGFLHGTFLNSLHWSSQDPSSHHTGPLQVSGEVPQKPLEHTPEHLSPVQVRQAFDLVGEFQETVVHGARYLM